MRAYLRSAILNGASRGRGGIDPVTMSGLLRSYRASNITGVADGGAVASWPDASPSNSPATQVTGANRAALSLAGAGGQPGVVLDGTDDYFNMTALTTGRTLLMVMRFDRPFNAYVPLIGSDTAFAGGGAEHMPLILLPNVAAVNGQNADCWFNGKAVGKLKAQARPSSLAVIAVRTAANFSANILTYGGAAGRFFRGLMAECHVFDRGLTDAEIVSASRWLCSRYGISFESRIVGPTANLVFDGDSLPFGQGSTGDNSFPAQLQAALTGGAQYFTRYNAAVAGSAAWTIAATRYAAAIPALYSDAFPKNIYQIWTGTNDLAGGNTPASVYASLKSIWAQARATGYKVAAFTIIARNGGLAISSAAFETARQDLNVLIRSDQTLYDGLVDVGADSHFDSTADTADGTYYIQTGSPADQTHLTNAGYAVLAGLAKPVVEALAA
ncbi:hypothetical protein BH10PSE1_BH10PSE1_00910 [soil metagenome]